MDFLHRWIVPPEASASSWLYVLTTAVAFFITAIAKGGFGGGIGVVSVPLMLQVAPARFVIGMWLPMLVICDLVTIRNYPKEWNPRAIMPLMPGVLLGIGWVTVALILLDVRNQSEAQSRVFEAWLKLGVAIMSSVFVLMQMRPATPQNSIPWKPRWYASLPVGFMAGVTSMVAHAAGPIVTMFFIPQKMDQRVFAGTCGRFYFIVNMLKIPFTAYAGLMTLVSLRYSMWLILLALPGVWLGSWLNKRINAVWFARVLYFSLVLAAAKLAYDAYLVL